MRARVLELFAIGCVLAALSAHADPIPVPGSTIQFDSEIERNFDEKPVKLRCTGVGLRERFFIDINAYAIASYIPQDAKIKSASELASADIPKVLHIKVERGFKGKKIADAFEKAILANYPRDRFKAELQGFKNFFLELRVEKNEDAWFTNIPGRGLRLNLGSSNEMQIPNVAFSKAVWDIYFGAHPISEDMKKGLTSLL
jgi:chalcone isomerase-like protein